MEREVHDCPACGGGYGGIRRLSERLQGCKSCGWPLHPHVYRWGVFMDKPPSNWKLVLRTRRHAARLVADRRASAAAVEEALYWHDYALVQVMFSYIHGNVRMLREEAWRQQEEVVKPA